jgi:hypothetical protein
VIEKDMPFYCVAANCTNKACLKDGISLHNIPYFNAIDFNDEHAEAKRRRKVWVDFVSKTIANINGRLVLLCFSRVPDFVYQQQFLSVK